LLFRKGRSDGASSHWYSRWHQMHREVSGREGYPTLSVSYARRDTTLPAPALSEVQ
jgi:hypothetical protein